MRLRHFLYYLLYVIAVVALSVVIVLAFHPHIGENTKSNKPSTGQKQGSTSTQNSNSSNAGNQGASTSQPSQTQPGQATGSATGQAPGSQLTNTGPGDTAALFAVAAVASGLGYRYYLVKKLKA